MWILLNNPDYEIVYEKHGWSFVKEFFSEFSTLDEGQDYAMLFLLSQNKSNHNAFVNTALGMLLSCNPKDPDNKRSLSCNASDSSMMVRIILALKEKISRIINFTTQIYSSLKEVQPIGRTSF